MDNLEWTSQQICNLIKEYIDKGNITYGEVLSVFGDNIPVKIITRREVWEVAGKRLYERRLTLDKRSDVTDKVVKDIEEKIDLDVISWDYLELIIDVVIQKLDIPFDSPSAKLRNDMGLSLNFSKK